MTVEEEVSMALYIRRSAGNPNDVYADIVKIVTRANIGALGYEVSPDKVQVTFHPAETVDFVAQRMFEICNAIDHDILVLGLSSGSQLPGGAVVSDIGGVCIEPGFFNPTDPILIAYDTTLCEGKGYYAFKSGGSTLANEIFTPSQVILFHELAHAYHFSIGDQPDDPLTIEAQAIDDENKLREFLDLQPNRDRTNHDGGCPFGSVPPKPKCFIVSAAFGSPRAKQVESFQRFRDVTLRPSPFAEHFFADLDREYYQFSPQIATEVEACPQLKLWVKRLVVEPLLDYLTLAELYVTERGCVKPFAKAVEETFDRYLHTLVEIKMQRSELDDVAQATTQAWARLVRRVIDNNNLRMAAPRAAFRADSVLNYLASIVITRAPTTTYTVWAVAEPLERYWRALARWVANSANPSEIVHQLGNGIEDWVATLPLPSTFLELSQESLATSLYRLADSIFTIQRVRHQFGERLLATCNASLTYDLRALLIGIGYLPAVAK
jgi:hypothetical protein